MFERKVYGLDKEIKEVSIKALTGGRAPLPEEALWFEPVIRKALKKQRLIARLYVVIGFLIIAGCGIRVFTNMALPPAESILYGFLALGAGGIGLVSIRMQMKLRFLYKMCKVQNYVVWPCRFRTAKGSSEKPRRQIKVTTVSGEACDEWYFVDGASAREAEKGLQHDFWLLAFPRGNKVLWSILISDGQAAKLNVGDQADGRTDEE